MKRLLLILAGLLLALPASAAETAKGMVTIRSSAAYTTSVTTQFINPNNCIGMFLYMDVTADPAAASVQPQMSLIDSSSGNVTTGNIGAARASTGDHVTLVAPAAAATVFVDDAVNIRLPYRFQLLLTHADTDSITYSASVQFIGCNN